MPASQIVAKTPLLKLPVNPLLFTLPVNSLPLKRRRSTVRAGAYSAAVLYIQYLRGWIWAVMTAAWATLELEGSAGIGFRVQAGTAPVKYDASAAHVAHVHLPAHSVRLGK